MPVNFINNNSKVITDNKHYIFLIKAGANLGKNLTSAQGSMVGCGRASIGRGQ